jgi:hypothetical protein
LPVRTASVAATASSPVVLNSSLPPDMRTSRPTTSEQIRGGTTGHLTESLTGLATHSHATTTENPAASLTQSPYTSVSGTRNVAATGEVEGGNDQGAGGVTGISSAWIVGIAAGCVVTGVILGVVIMKLVQRRCGRGKKQSYSPDSSNGFPLACI